MLCHKNEVTFGVILAIVSGVVVMFIGATKLTELTNIKEQKSLTWTPVPWLGVLTLEGNYKIATEGLILVTIISDKVGIADAKSMTALNKYKWEEIRNNTHVKFLTKTSQDWYARVDKFILHPEFNDETLTTMAIVNLEYDLNKFEGNMVKWPFKFSYPTNKDDDIFTIGYTNSDRKLEQTVYRMDYIQLSECQNFYFLEALDTKWMRPKHYHCYKVRYNKNSCVFDPAMALVHYAAGKYTLMGLSVWGPGCALPTRFFDFEPFVPWIMSNVQTRRRVRYYWRPEVIGYKGLGETKKQRDRWMLERLSDSKELALRPKGQPPLVPTLIENQCIYKTTNEVLALGDKVAIAPGKVDRRIQTKNLKQTAAKLWMRLVKNSWNGSEEIVRGKCDGKNMKNDMLVYREVQEYKSRRRVNKKYIKGIAVYALSLYDLKFTGKTYTCIQIIAKCKQKSNSTLEFSRGLGNEPLDPYVKSGYEHRPSYVLNQYVHTLQNNYEIIEEDTTHLTFRFEFEKEATIEIAFYTTRKVATTPRTTTENIEQRSRSRRPYTTSTKDPPRQYWFYKYGYNKHGGWTTKAVVYRPKTTRTKKRKTNRPSGENGSKYWWNEWWHYVTKPSPDLDKDWWKG